MTNTLASIGMRWRPSVAESADAARYGAASHVAAAPAAAQKCAAAKPQTHGTQLSADTAAVRLRGYAFAIRPRGTPPV